MRLSGRQRLRVVALVAYAAVAVGWIYGVVANGDAKSHVGIGLELPGVLLVYLLLGVALASWWAALLPAATILVALPAKENPELHTDLDWVFFDPLAMLPYALLAVALGTAIGRRSGLLSD